MDSDDFFELLKREVNKTADHPAPVRFLTEEGDTYDVLDVAYDVESDVFYIKGELFE